MWLYAVETERIKDPGSKKLDVLRSYLLSQQIKSHPPG